MFNTNEEITDFRPLSKYSLLAIINSSAYEICINGKYNGKCIDECPEGQNLTINAEKGNYCEGKECNILLKTNNTCVDICDEQKYIMNGKECGLCKHLNKTFPYKIINKKNCIEEKPNNTYFIDQSLYLLNDCHSSCETCWGDNSSQCLSCSNSFLLNGSCNLNCPEGYYKNKNINKNINICSECDTNCSSCDGGKENNNSHCLSCKDTYYLVKAKGFDQNCVENCPNNTKPTIKKDLKVCLSENDEEDDNTEEKNFFKKNKTWIWVAIILISLIIIIIIVTIIFIKICKKNKNNVNLRHISEDDYMVIHSDNNSQDWSLY